MGAAKLHSDEADIDARLVRRLLVAQIPEWSPLRLERVDSAGTSNALYRLGDDMVVRLPRVAEATGQIAKEHRWLPWLAPLLPLAIPEPLVQGVPGEGYPWPWSVYRWIEGEVATHERLADPSAAARTLGGFVAALQRLDPPPAPKPDLGTSSRGAPLATRDAAVRAAITALAGTLAPEAATAAWEAALRAREWEGPPVWLHGDLYETNLLASGGRLTAVIDFGCLGVGDPACDLLAARMYLTAETRAAFRAELAIGDDATWARGRGWALSMGLIALPYYLHSNPAFAQIARTGIDEVLADCGRG
jgi:aminoglycoside phosphotransferase (APT) family kinase protein